MDREQEERRYLGFFGIVKESIKIIFTWRKIFSQITLAFILPPSLVALAHIEIFAFLLAKVRPHKLALVHAEADTPKYHKLSNMGTLNAVELFLSLVVALVLVVIFSLLSKSAVVYTTACTYASKSITFRGVMKALPKASKRLMTINLSISLAVSVFVITTMQICLLVNPKAIALTLGLILLILCLSGSVYPSVISGLAGVVSVVEDIYGVQAMLKSVNLIKGKWGVSIAIDLLLSIGSLAIQTVFYISVAHGHGSGVLRLGVAILCFLLLIKLFLFSLVMQTVIYFVCKSYHHENIDKSLLADHLELAEYLPP